ncbi:hypothetical protein BOW53_13065 [Solemya pervernicosa gill symbiont]|uniref:diguanylate cyclase n=1 Tax=Solemya pervernicosa gill symbiont TaxID=642797 RepID=A0A1T2L1V4_9GAMM|nr:hypothetical protein BOW53_13065 [Solemya pervernicosa gill symbiont]
MTRALASVWNEIGTLFAEGGLSKQQLIPLLYTRSHGHYLARHRSAVINRRVRLFAVLFALLFIPWIGVDYQMLPSPLAADIAVLRLVSTVIFLAVGLSVTAENRWNHAGIRLVVLMAVPLIFYLLVQRLSSNVVVDGYGTVLIEIYNLLPFLVVAGLAIFPLTISESMSIGIISLVVMGVGQQISDNHHLHAFLPAAWILFLLLCVCVMSAATQLNYMTSLMRRVNIDPLTGAFTRQSGQELIDLYFLLAMEQQRPFTIMFLDLDHFKQINDNCGHDAGDAALKSAVENLKHHLRRDDYVVRWGGEEFLLIMLDTDRESMQLPLQRICSGWLGERPDGTPLTASIGIAERIRDGIEDWVGLVELADTRMYRAKQEGRARVVDH